MQTDKLFIKMIHPADDIDDIIAYVMNIDLREWSFVLLDLFYMYIIGI